MWKSTIKLLFFVVLSATAFGKNALPKFRIAASRSHGQPPAIAVNFANGVSDTLVLTPHHPVASTRGSSCSFLGHLKNAKSPVAVTGCLASVDDKLTITMLTREQPEAYMFKVDGYGKAEKIESPFVKGQSRALPKSSRLVGSGWHQEGDEMVNDELEAAPNAMELLGSTTVNFPEEMNLVVKIGYEKSLKNKVGDEDAVATWVNDVMTHTQAHFNHDTLKTKVKITVQPGFMYKDVTWTADNNLDEAISAGNQLDSSAETDAYVWFCADTSLYGTVGIAYLGAVCDYYVKGSINEWASTTAATGETVAHEIGHNLGMDHDFAEKHEGKNCTGIMDYDNPPNVWSSCSVDDFWTHYSTNDWGNTCLTSGSSGSSPAPAPAPAPPTLPESCEVGWWQDGTCDDENNSAECQYDGGDCCLTSAGWDKYCSECECKDPSAPPPPPPLPDHCAKGWIGDGGCDDINNSAECNYDGGDCCNNTKPGWNNWCTVCECLEK